MTNVNTAALPGAEERDMLRRSLRDLLAKSWPSAQAVERAQNPQATAALWSELVTQGIATLGSHPSEGGLSEIIVVMEELGRAACPAPFEAAALANLAFTNAAENSVFASLLGGLHAGTARVCVDLGDGSCRTPPSLTARGKHVDGTLRYVDSALCATHLLARQPNGIAIVDLTSPTALLTPTRALGGDALSEIRLHKAPAEFIPLEPLLMADLRHAARLMRIARAHGAPRRAFEMAVDYAKERRQFGQPIGRFQAIQHKLANAYIALESVRLTLHHAAASFDARANDWRYFSSAAAAFAGTALRQVSLETQHAFGAIGYADDHEAPRHFKRVHLDCIAFGGAAAARAELAAHMLDCDQTLPEYDLGDAGNAFRREVRDWLQENWSGRRKAAFDGLSFSKREFDPAFARDLGRTGWLGLGWPRAFGGQARTPLEQLAFIEVMERAEAPRIGAGVQANALMMFGSDVQKARYLPEILSGEAMHGMGYSEPDAGSDLAALRTTAVREGDTWVINGQKIWTTTYWGKYMFLAARTDRCATPPHKGISMFIVPMDTPGITVHPSKTMYDGSFANIFYDDVRLPLDALLGPLDGGWKVLTDALANERGVVGGGIALKVAHAFNLLCADIRDAAGLHNDALVRDRVGTLAADIEVGRQLMIHCAELATNGTTPPEMGAISKVFSGELMERFGEAALDIFGLDAALSQGTPGAMRNGRYEQNLRHSLMWVISIGTNEIQRSLIAQRGLGLPR